MGRDDSYRFELEAHPGWSNGAARYDDGLAAQHVGRPALTEISPGRGPSPEPTSLPSPVAPFQHLPSPHRHTRYDEAGIFTAKLTVIDAIERTDDDTQEVKVRLTVATAGVSGSSVDLAWDNANNASQFTRYEVHKSASPGFQPDAFVEEVPPAWLTPGGTSGGRPARGGGARPSLRARCASNSASGGRT